MAPAQEGKPDSDLTDESLNKRRADPDRIATSLIIAGIAFLLLAVADTIAVRGFGLGTLWGSVMGAAFLAGASLIWKRKTATPG